MRVVVVTGGRDYARAGPRRHMERSRLRSTLERLEPDIVVHGAAPGADEAASRWAMSTGTPQLLFPTKAGVLAEAARNRQMLDFVLDLRGILHEVTLVAFPGGEGRADCVRQARKINLRVLEVRDA
ncbi:MAG: SLOG family protein [Myxococcota bacterium]